MFKFKYIFTTLHLTKGSIKRQLIRIIEFTTHSFTYVNNFKCVKDY